MNEEAILARLDTLEAEVAELKVTAGLVKPAARDAESAKFVERGVTITHPEEINRIVLPNESEYRKLLAVVLDAYPQLRRSNNPRYATEDEAGFFREFCAAFERISRLLRTEKVDHKRSVSWWANEANQQRFGREEIRGLAFIAATVGAGDVSFVEADHNGNSWAFALAFGAGRPATEAGWRRVLNGQLLAPIAGRFGAPSARPSVRLEAEQ
jgi:hypothetical protein